MTPITASEPRSCDMGQIKWCQSPHASFRLIDKLV